MNNLTGTILAFDVGERRIGVAKATVPPRLAQPLITLDQNDELEEALKNIIKEESPTAFVVGFPRNQQGEITHQTKSAESWAQRYLSGWNIPIFWQDESLTSVAAEKHLEARGGSFTKAEVDSLAANIILTDFLESN